MSEHLGHQPCKRGHLLFTQAVTNMKNLVGQLWEDDLTAISIFKNIFYVQGFWPTQETNIFPGYALRHTNPRCVILCATYLAFISCPIAAYHAGSNELIDTLELVGLIFVALLTAFDTVSLVYLGGRFKDLMTALEVMRQRGSLHAEQPKSILKQTKMWSLFSVFYFGQCVFNTVVFVFGMIPQLMEKRRFYASGWYPYDSTATPYFEITLLGWVASLTSASCLIALVNAFFMAIIVQAIGQFQLLNHNLKAMHRPEGDDPEFSSETLPDTNEANNLTNPNRESGHERSLSGVKVNVKVRLRRAYERLVKERAKKLREKKAAKKKFGGFLQSPDVQMKIMVDRCARHHQSILSFVGCINSAFNLILIQYYTCCFFPSLIAIILVTYSSEITLKIMLIAVLGIVANLTLGFYCFLGCKITEEGFSGVYNWELKPASEGWKGI